MSSPKEKLAEPQPKDESQPPRPSSFASPLPYNPKVQTLPPPTQAPNPSMSPYPGLPPNYYSQPSSVPYNPKFSVPGYYQEPYYPYSQGQPVLLQHLLYQPHQQLLPQHQMPYMQQLPPQLPPQLIPPPIASAPIPSDPSRPPSILPPTPQNGAAAHPTLPYQPYPPQAPIPVQPNAAPKQEDQFLYFKDPSAPPDANPSTKSKFSSKMFVHSKHLKSPSPENPQEGQSNTSLDTVKRFACTYEGCSWAFARQSDLRRHEKSHRSPMFHCPYWRIDPTCHKNGGSFNRLDVLKRHLRLVHYVRDKEHVIPGSDPGWCRACQKVFPSSKQFVDHCSECASKFLPAEWRALASTRIIRPGKHTITEGEPSPENPEHTAKEEESSEQHDETEHSIQLNEPEGHTETEDKQQNENSDGDT